MRRLGWLLIAVTAALLVPIGAAGAQTDSGISEADLAQYGLESVTEPEPLSRATRLHVQGMRSQLGLRTDAAFLKRLHSYPERFHAVRSSRSFWGNLLVTPDELPGLGVPIEVDAADPELQELESRVNDVLRAAHVNVFGTRTDADSNRVEVMVGSRANARRSLRGVVPADAISYDVIPAPIPGPDDGNRRFGPATSFLGARTNGRRGIVVSFVGGAPVTDPHDPCQVEYRARAFERAGEVRIEVRAKRRFVGSQSGEPHFCTDKGYGRTAEVELDRPLGNRPLVDGATNDVVPVFDGSTLLRPTWLPTGWKFRSEGGENNETFGSSWSRGFGLARADDEACPSVPTGVVVAQGPPNKPGAPVVDSYTIVDTVEVRGHPAQRGIDPRFGSTTIRWVEPSGQVVLDGYASCAGSPGLDLETLTRIAQGLR